MGCWRRLVLSWRFRLDPATAEATHRMVLPTLSDDGTVSDAMLKDLIEQTKAETGVKKDFNIRDIVDYSLVGRFIKRVGEGIILNSGLTGVDGFGLNR